MAEERTSEAAGIEQIQLHAVDPNTQITIAVPSIGSDDPEIQKSREIFETFPPGLQRALESGSLDEVNKVLGKLSVEEAEEVVGLLGEVCEPQVTTHYLQFNSLHSVSGRDVIARKPDHRRHNRGRQGETQAN